MNRERYFDRFGREVSEREAFDGNALRDGYSMRVPHTMMDSAADHRPRITDGTNNPLGLHRPGFRIDAAAGRAAVHDAYDAYDREVSNRWRGTEAESPRANTVEDAYAEYDRYVSNAWRSPQR
jgi:hypothetical protein